jgi:hypothetical protein
MFEPFINRDPITLAPTSEALRPERQKRRDFLIPLASAICANLGEQIRAPWLTALAAALAVSLVASWVWGFVPLLLPLFRKG